MRFHNLAVEDVQTLPSGETQGLTIRLHRKLDVEKPGVHQLPTHLLVAPDHNQIHGFFRLDKASLSGDIVTSEMNSTRLLFPRGHEEAG